MYGSVDHLDLRQSTLGPVSLDPNQTIILLWSWCLYCALTYNKNTKLLKKSKIIIKLYRSISSSWSSNATTDIYPYFSSDYLCAKRFNCVNCAIAAENMEIPTLIRRMYFINFILSTLQIRFSHCLFDQDDNNEIRQ